MDTPAPPPADPIPPFTQRPSSEELWRRARQDYLGGDTARVVCERYQLSQRTFYGRAAREGWRRTDVEASINDGPPAWSNHHYQDAVDVIADRPEFAEIQAARDNDAFNLLFSPDAEDLRGFAFRRACEAAALYKPAEAAAWLRVQRLLDHAQPVRDPRDGPYRPEDHLRASYIRAMTAPTGPEDETPP